MDYQDGARENSERTGIDFLDAELDLCQTFLDVADNEKDHPESAAFARTKAQQGYQTVLDWIATVHDPQNLNRLTAKLHRLKERIDKPSF